MQGWIAVDLDGTLAQYDGWQGAEHIGAPIPAMVQRVKRWLADGHGVKIFTARASGPDSAAQITLIQDWLERAGLPRLEVTATKDYGMIECWDDRCTQVVPNTGLSLLETLRQHGHGLVVE